MHRPTMRAALATAALMGLALLAPVNTASAGSPVTGSYKGDLRFIRTVSATSAYASGITSDRKIVQLRWNGTSWLRTTRPSPFGTTPAVTDASGDWTFGPYIGCCGNTKYSPRIARRSGTGHVTTPLSATPTAGVFVEVTGVLAVGSDYSDYRQAPVMAYRYSGGTWVRQAIPAIGTNPFVSGTDGTWVYGMANRGTGRISLMQRKRPDGTWISAPVEGNPWVRDVAGSWAIGDASRDVVPRSVMLRWNGSAWRRFPIPQEANVRLFATDGTSAVGDVYDPRTRLHSTYIIRWNGSRWVRTPSPRDSAILQAVSGRWAAGYSGGTYDPARMAYMLRWTGREWVRA